MADPAAPASPDVLQQRTPLDDIGEVSGSTAPSVQANQPTGTPLDDLGDIAPSDTSAFGAGGRAAAKATLPAAGGLAAAGAGAELGAAAGTFATPGLGTAIGGIAGGIGGFFAGAKAVEAAQNWALSKLPDSFVDGFGLDERTERLDQQQHPVASFVGGLVPYAVTMSPSIALKKGAEALPENATALQRLMAHPATAKLFGGGVMGGMELGNEIHDNEDLDWRKIGIATAFGTVFNKPTKLGEAITERGAGPVRTMLGRPSPTVAQAGDLKVMGPGVTEQVFQGAHEQAPQAAQVAQETARAETPEQPGPDLNAIARKMEPETFAEYDRLMAQQDAFRKWINDFNAPPPEAFAELETQRDALQKQLDEHIASRGGYAAGPEARKLRAQIRSIQSEHDTLTDRAEAFAKGQAEETADISMARQHLQATEFQLRDLQPQIAAAYRRAADSAGTETIPAEPFKSFAEMLAARERDNGQAQTMPPVQQEPGQGPQPVSGVPSIQPGGEAQPEAGGQAGTAPAVPPGPQRSIGDQIREAFPEAIARPGAEINHLGAASAPGRPAFKIVAGPTQPVRSIGDQRAFIAQDVSRRLIAAGRPEDEASAAGQVIAARYVTRAGRFEGKLGTPEELYARQGAAIAGPTGKPQAPASAPLPEKAVTAPKPRGRAAADPRTWTLSEYLASKGGLKPDPELHAIYGGKKGPMIGGFGPLLRNSGMTLDEALRVAKEGHYMLDAGDITGAEGHLTPNDLLDLLGNETRGQKVYRNDHIPEEKVNPEEERTSIIDALHRELQQATGETPKVDPALEDRVVEIMQREGEHDILAAYERAIMEDHDRYENLRDDRQATEHIPGWDAPDIGAASRAGEEHPGEGGAAGLPAEAAREDHGGQPQDHGAGDRAAALAQSVDEYFQRVYHGTDLFEPGAEGKPQQLIPGIEPITERDRIQAAANKPPPEGGLFGSAKDQGELFQEVKGKIKISKDARPIITLLKTADASTFVHESGHQFLEELLQDAAHPEAPQMLRDDAQTVRDWLGAPDEIKTKHHEKFARGFEQYMREGVAPSPELAGVFAKFRNWLLTIYQSIKGLGTEISPEIRSVFDRMLEMEPQRTVIAPERPAPNMLHDIHEAEAQHTEPHEAEPVMDRIIAERDRYITEQPPEVQREIEAALAKIQPAEGGGEGTAAGETSTGAGGPSEMEPSGAGPWSQSGGGAGGEEHGAEQPSGSGAGAESPSGSAGSDLRSKLGGNAGTALAPAPAEQFGPRESPLVDKAGNIRIENLTTNEDVAQAIRVAAQENDDFIGDRRGVITDGQVLDLADALGMDAETLNRRQLGQAFNAEQIVAARKLLVQSATVVSEAMKKAATGSDADVMAYAQAKDRHQMIQAHVAGITAEAGRALRAFRSIAGQEQATAIGDFVQQATGKTLFQLRAEAKLGAELQTPQQVSKMMRDAQDRSFGRMVLEYWINGLISGPATHMTYAVGNTISSLLRIPEQLASAGVGRVLEAYGREGPRVRAGEALEMARAAVRELPGAIKAGIGGLETGLTTQLPGEEAAQGTLFQPGAMGAPKQFQEGATYHEAMSAVYGIVQGMRDGLLATGKLISAGGVHGEPLVSAQYSPLGAIPDIAVKGVNVLPVGSIVRAPGRFIAAIHSFYRATNFSMEKAALAYRKGAEEGLEGDALAQRVAQIRSDPSEATMNELAVHQATATVLMGKGSELTQALSRLTNAKVFGFPLLKFIDPFVHISGNIIDQAVVQRTPVGLLTLFSPETELARDLTGKNGGASQDKAIGRMMVGSALSMTFGSLAAQGLMSGSGPKDPKEANVWRMAGNQAHSVRIGDFWYDVHRLGPLGMLAGISADLYDVAHNAEQGEFLQAAAHLQHAFTQNILDESFMKGPADLIQAVEDPGRYGESYVRNFLASFVPMSVGTAQIARAMDPYTRQARTVTDAIKAKIPGLSESLYPKRDIWGEPIPSREVLGAPGVSAIYVTRMNNDLVNKALLDLNIFPGAVERKIRNVELTDKEYDDFARQAGRMAKPSLDKVVKSPMWQTMPVEARHYVVQHTIESARETARGMMMAQYPHIAADAAAIKQKLARGEKP